MTWLDNIFCGIGVHCAGRYCAYCGKRLDVRPLHPYRVTSRGGEAFQRKVLAVDEEHAFDLVGRGWHRENLIIERMDEDRSRGDS